MLQEPMMEKLTAMRLIGMVDALKAQEQDPASRELSFLERLGLLVDQPPQANEPPRLLKRNEWLRSEHEGIFLCRVRPGDAVTAGQVLGQMVDLLGEPLAEVRSPDDGVILFTVTSPAIKRGGLLLAVGVP